MRDEHAVCMFEDCFVMFGGYVGGLRCSNDLFMYVFDEKRWHLLEVHGDQQPSPRAGSTIICNRNRVTIFGGKDEEGKKMQDVWHFDLENRKWQFNNRLSEDSEFDIL